VNAFLLLYALAISIELMLSLLMAIFLFLIAAPVGSHPREEVPEATPPTPPLAHDVRTALSDAFVSISTAGDDLATIANARALLDRYRREHADSAASRR